MVTVLPQRLHFSHLTVPVWISLYHIVGRSLLSASLSSETSSHEHYHEQPTLLLFPCCSQSLSFFHHPCFFQPHLVALSTGLHLLLPFYSVEDSFTGILLPLMTDHFSPRPGLSAQIGCFSSSARSPQLLSLFSPLEQQKLISWIWHGGLGSISFMVGLDDLKGLFQPK